MLPRDISWFDVVHQRWIGARKDLEWNGGLKVLCRNAMIPLFLVSMELFYVQR